MVFDDFAMYHSFIRLCYFSFRLNIAVAFVQITIRDAHRALLRFHPTVQFQFVVGRSTWVIRCCINRINLLRGKTIFKNTRKNNKIRPYLIQTFQ